MKKHMARLIIDDKKTDDLYLNLAIEEVLIDLLVNSPYDFIIRFWRNPKSVVLGRGQVLEREINVRYCNKHGIEIGRRISGGGAVYQDHGNLNISFIAKKQLLKETRTEAISKMFVAVIFESLQEYGIRDLKYDKRGIYYQSKKVSGFAAYKKKEGVLFHATLLHAANLEALENSLLIKESNTKGTLSRYSPTINLPRYDENIWKKILLNILKEKFVLEIVEEPLTHNELFSAEHKKALYTNINWIKMGKKIIER